MALTAIPLGAGRVGADRHDPGPSTLRETPFVQAPPTGSSGPDDLTRLAVKGVDGGRALIWTAFQNGIGADGTPGKSGATQSTVAGFDPKTGHLVESIPVTGKVDGLTADGHDGTLLATENEDLHSSFNVIDPVAKTVTTYAYSPDPGASGAGGTDSIAVQHGHIYVAHSNPSDTTQAAMYLVTLDTPTHTATLQPVFFDNSVATDAVAGQSAQLALSDPDTNYVMPAASPEFAHQVATVSQADGEIVFASHLVGTPHLTVLNVTDNVAGNVPPIDGLGVATADDGTLYVVDSASSSIHALSTAGWPAGTVFVTEASDNGNPLLGVLDLGTGKITPLGNTFVSPKEVLFVPAHGEGDQHDG
jgi:hypothetical protein